MEKQIEFYSATDLHNLFKLSRQYYDKLMKTGVIESRKTSAGYITTNIWFQKYTNKNNNDTYK